MDDQIWPSMVRFGRQMADASAVEKGFKFFFIYKKNKFRPYTQKDSSNRDSLQK